MQVAIVSDIHDNLSNLQSCLNYCQERKIKKIICSGDTGNIETIKYFANNFLGEIFIICGNADTYREKDLESFKNIRYKKEIFFFEIDNLKIAICHEPEKIKTIKEIQSEDLDFIFYGHTHKPWLEIDKKTIIVNPGTLGGVFYPATFSILNTKTKILSLKRLFE